MEQEIEPKAWGRFQLVSHLGKGGMGDVYKAYDPNLNRHVALKILRHEDSEVVRRFLREARSQAKVDHRYVCKIYESGECDNHPYIAMQYIEGQNLNEVKDQLNLEEKIRVIKNVALGLHAAHGQGLIHRDVKPANIMLNQNEEDRWKPYIMDFGIAREQEAPGLTSTGMVVGTPYYMAPEQTKGRIDIVDRRCDIYSLGVTMYELLSGDVPFHGDTPVEVLLEVLEKDPLPLRKLNSRIPVDIETIVMKCLEKDPNRRYSSAKELADDLQRYLDGDPIQASPPSKTYLLKRKLVKHKLPILVTGVAVIVIIILIGLWLQAKWAASQRALIAQELGQEVEKIESTIHYAHLLPIHDLSREKDQIRTRINRIEEKIKKVGKMGLGPGNYAMGRGYMALQEYTKAKDHLEKSWNSGYQTPEVAYEMGRVWGELYFKESEKANRIESKEMREARRKEIEKTYREPALKYIRQGARIQGESKDYIEALIAFYELNYDRALNVLLMAVQKADKDSTWLNDAKILEGNIYFEIGRDQTNIEESVKYLLKAEEAYQAAIKSAESDMRGYIGLTRVLERQMMIEVHSKGRDLQPLVERAITLCQKSLQIDPGMADIFVTQSSVYRWLGRSQMIGGKDPVQSLDLSIDSAQNAVNLHPDNFEGYAAIGLSNVYKAEYRMAHGQDPTPEFDGGEINFKKAIKINPNYVSAYNGMGNIYIRKAEYEMSQGKDPGLSLNQAEAIFEKALFLYPEIVNLHNGLAAALWIQSNSMMSRGQNPLPTMLKAVKSLENALKINPGFSHFYSNLGFVYMDMARYELDNGFEPLNNVNRSLEYFEKSLKINPKGNELYTGLVSVMWIQTKYEYLMGRDNGKSVSQAYNYYKRGLDSNPNDPLLYLRMASNLIIQARYKVERNQSPTNILEQADGLLKKAKSLNPKNNEIYVQEGELWLLKANWALKEKKSSEQDFVKAEVSLKQALGLNPKDIQVYLVRAWMNLVKVESGISQGQAPVKNIEDGLESLNRATAINPNNGEVYALRGLLLRSHAKLTTDQTKREADEIEVQRNLLKAVQINRNLRELLGSYVKAHIRE